MKKSKKHRKIVIILIILAALAIVSGIFLFVILSGQRRNMEEMTTVQKSQAEVGSISSTVEGTGNLTAAESSSVKIPKGLVIEEIKVQNGQIVKAGDTIATVTKASVASELLSVKESIESVTEELDDISDDASDTDSTEYLQKLILESELADLEDIEDVLNTIMESGTITAPSSGTIANLNIEEGSTAETASQTSSSNASTLTSSNSGQYTVSLLSTADTQSTDEEITQDIEETPTPEETPIPEETPSVEPTEPAEPTEPTEPAEPILITECNDLEITAPKSGAIPQKEIAVSDNASAHYTGTITWDNTDATFKEEVSYTATIILTADEGYAFTEGILVELDHTLLLDWKVFGEGSGNRLRIVAVYEKTTKNVSDKNENSSSDSILTPEASANTSKGTSSAGGSGASQSTVSSEAASGDSNSNASTSSSESLLTTIAAISSNEKVNVNINVDELDILTVEEGQKATVTLDALENETFEGSVTSIASEADTGSGSIKYVVSVELNKTDNMLIGMSAAATINIKEAENVLTIPVNALQESGEKVFVYTECDENGNLSGEVEITTGLSDGTQVEVLKGLSENDTVYYTRVSLENNENPFGGGMPNGGGGGFSMPGGGNFSGGQRPS